MIKTKTSLPLLLLAIAFGSIGCNPGIIEPPPVVVTDATAYFWNNPVAINFLDSNGTTGGKFIHLTLSPVNDTANVFSLSERAGTSSSDVVTYTLGSDAVSISGITTHSFIPLPDGYSIKGKITIIPHQSSPISFKHILAVTPSSIVAASNDSEYYSADSGKTWNNISSYFSGGSGTVTALTYIGHNVYAGTSLGLLFISSDDGQRWAPSSVLRFNGSILALATDPATLSLYISAGDTVFSIGVNNSQPLTRLAGNNGKQFTSLAYGLGSIPILIAGTAKGGLWYDYRDSGWLQSDLPYPPHDAAIKSVLSTLHGFYCSTSGSTSTVYYSSNGTVWIKAVYPFSDGIFAYDGNAQAVVVANSTDSVIRFQDPFSPGKVSGFTSIPVKNVNDISVSYPNYFAATDLGIYKKSNYQSSWQPVFGNSSNIQDTIKFAGEITLLRSLAGSISPDSSWQACTLVKSNLNTEFPVTARIVGHLDQVTMHDSTTYNDVIEVQYSYELGGKPSPIIPYWQIYYAKGVGPIIIYEIYNNSDIISKIYRTKP